MGDQIVVPVATSLAIQAKTLDDARFQGRSCYRLQGRTGVWRRVQSRQGRTGLEAADGNVVGVISQKRLVEFALWPEITETITSLQEAVSDGRNGQ